MEPLSHIQAIRRKRITYTDAFQVIDSHKTAMFCAANVKRAQSHYYCYYYYYY